MFGLDKQKQSLATLIILAVRLWPGWSKKHDEEVRQEDIIKYNPDMIGPIPGTEVEEDGPGSLASIKKRKQDGTATAIEVGVEVSLA